MHTINYYDDYGFRSLAGFDNESYFPKESHPAGGLLTGTVTTLLDGSGKKLYTAYYDEKGRLEKTVSSNHLDGYDTTTTVYTFTGKPKTVTHVHTAMGKAQQTQVYTYTYDHADRVKTVTHKLNAGSTITLANNTYDDLGRLKKNSRNGVSSLSDTYEYNVRSWLTGISGAQHTENLTYDYNGNISSMQWRLDGTTRKYAYSYDPLSRLVSATFSGGKDAERYSTSYSYDKHGNILSLQRYGKTANSDLGVYGLADNLTMTYNGNQLTSVSDAAVTVTLPESNDFKKGSTANPGYAYDKNGNLTKDLNKKITAISYNSLYLPELLTIDGVTHKYTYAADGRKLKVTQGSTSRDYAGSVIYENGSLKRILVDGGYIEGGTYYFYFNDHLGNVRAVIDMNNYNIQFNHYYPFGLPMAETTDGKQNEQPYKYNGKEFERKNGLNWMDYGARHYDAALGRFTTMDPLAEKYYEVSPYAYCMNNPVIFVDPDGRKVYFAPGVSAQFKQDFAKSVQYLNSRGAGGMLAKLEKSDKVYYIAESSEAGSKYDTENKTITWASKHGLLTNEGIMLSATSVLNHEVDHALQHDQNPEQQKADGKRDLTNPYTNKEEERVITGSEQETAKKLGEIKDGEVTRKDHGGTLYEMKSSTSTEIKDEIIIIPK